MKHMTQLAVASTICTSCLKYKFNPLEWNNKAVPCLILVLTGTISPCQVKMFDSSTWMLRKFFIPDLRISSSSCEIAQIQDMTGQH